MTDTVNILSIAGSDPSGGAGIQADLKTFSALGAYGMAVITGLTAQNTQGVYAVHNVPADFLKEQLKAVFEDIRVDGVKIGMVGSAENAKIIAEILVHYEPEYIVLDPVMMAQSGDRLIDDEAIQAIRSHLLPLASLVTPNIPEAKILAGLTYNGDGDLRELARAVTADSVYLKGGHSSDEYMATDIYAAGPLVEILEAPRIDTPNNHGTGCTLSSALAVFMAQGMSGPASARASKVYLSEALEAARDLQIGQGAGPVQHFWNLWEG